MITSPHLGGIAPALRIALFAESCSAGVGRHVIDLAEHLHLADHAIHLIHSQRHTDLRFRAGLKHLRLLGVPTLDLAIAHSLHVSDVWMIGRVRSYLLRNGPFDIVHSHSTKAGFIGRLACLGTGFTSIYTPHAFMTMSPVNNRPRRTLARGLELALSGIGDCVICVSDEERRHAVEIGLSPGKLCVVLNGIDLTQAEALRLKRAEVRSRLAIQPDDIVIGFVGRFADQKAPEMLVQSYARLAKSCHGPLRLLMVGSGPLRRSCETQACALGIREQVIFEENLPGAIAMSAFDVFALPSRYEGFPYVLLEALATGLPIVSTAVGGSNTLVKANHNGFVTKVGDVTAFTTALDLIVSDSNLRNRMSEASRQLSKDFSVKRMSADTLAVYENLLYGSRYRIPAEVTDAWDVETQVKASAE